MFESLSSELTRMNLQRIALLSVAGFGLAACSSDTGPTVTGVAPHASVRYINAVPDTNKTEFRFVDQIEGSPYYGQLAFRNIAAYQVVTPGARHIRIFSVDPAIDAGTSIEADPNVVSQKFVDTTITFEADKYYTIIHVGYARAGATPKQHLVVLTDDRSAVPTSSQIAVQVINAAPTLASVDVYPAATATGTALFPGIAFGSESGYKVLSTGTVTFAAAMSGSTTVAASMVAPVGAPPASISQSALGGYSIGGSMLTAFIFPPSVPGSLAASSTTASVIWMQDNFPQTPGT
jgi:hypothetical protein